MCEWGNIILTCAIALFTGIQCVIANMHRKTELFKYRIQHIQDLKTFWDKFHKNMNYITQIRAIYKIPKNYEVERYNISKFLENHLLFTKCYFGNEIYFKERFFSNLLDELLPPAYVDADTCNMDVNKFDKIEEKYSNLFNSMVKKV